MTLTRRHFMLRAGALTAGFAGLQTGLARGAVRATALDSVASGSTGYGPLVPDPAKVFDLPAGFSYTVVSRHGEEMCDGLLTPGAHDGMAAFPGEGPLAGKTVLVCNHEIDPGHPASAGPFGAAGERRYLVPPGAFYDAGACCLGGTTTVVYDTRTKVKHREFLSLTGTSRNCAGGPTPWNSWLTCEESVFRPGDGAVKDGFLKNHGYVFEVPAALDSILVEPKPIKDMGRFYHEAVAVDPRTGVVYLSEDRPDGLIYRYLPNEPRGGIGSLHKGGRLQALKVTGQASRLLQNWGNGEPIPIGTTLEVEWVDLSDTDPAADDLRARGFADHGAAQFARTEGMWWGNGSAYWACTSGGARRLGQIWRYTASPHEGTPGEKDRPARLQLFIEPNDSKSVSNADNICVAPWGDLVVCEDTDLPDQHLIIVTPEGRTSRLGRNAVNASELAGCCFSPDGSTLFVNIQHPGLTIAITGPWRRS